MAAADRFEIVVEGRQTHGSTPWKGVDPIVVSAQIVSALQTIVSRHVELVKEPAVVTVGQMDAGVRNNIIPDRARLVGTIRTFDEVMRTDIHARVRQIAEHIAASGGARAVVTIEKGYPVTANPPDLTTRMVPTLERVAPAARRSWARSRAPKTSPTSSSGCRASSSSWASRPATDCPRPSRTTRRGSTWTRRPCRPACARCST
jgi:amidohydrolase